MTQGQLDGITDAVFGDYPELKGYGMQIEAADYVYDSDGNPIGGEWYSQGRIRIGTAGFSVDEVRGTVLHELLHVDASNHGWTMGIRGVYAWTGQNHAEIYNFQANYSAYLSGTPYLSPPGQITTQRPSLGWLSWRN